MNNTDSELKIVFGHKPIMFNVPSDWKILTTDPANNNEKSFYVNDDSVWTKDNNFDILSEWGYLILLAKKLKTMPEIKTIRLAQYRKIVSNVKIEKSVLHSGHNVIQKKILNTHNIDTITKASNSNYMIAQCVVLDRYVTFGSELLFNTILDSHHHHHHIEDLLRFTADAIACGEISELDANLFLHMNKGIYGGMGLGVFPAANFIKHMEKLEKILNFHYANKWKKRSDSYQYRNLGFCLEKMSSYLLFKELSELGIKWKSVLGNMLIISDDNIYHRGIKSI
jgi:hypothetical protein